MNTLPPPLCPFPGCGAVCIPQTHRFVPFSRFVQSLPPSLRFFTSLPLPRSVSQYPPREADVQYIYNRPHPGVRFGWLHMYSRGSHQQYTLSLGRSSVRTLTYTYNQFGMPKTDIRTYGRTWPIEDPTLDSRSVPGFRQSLPY